MVVDRFKVRSDLGLRLAESFETALGLTDGLAAISFMDTKQKDISFSSRFACPDVRAQHRRVGTAHVFVQQPCRRVQRLRRSGREAIFDEERLVLYPESSLAEGAIRGWDRRNVYYFHMLTSLAEHYGFDIDTPFSALSKKIRQDHPAWQRYPGDRIFLYQRPGRRVQAHALV